jgi:hypothetical protein
MIGGVIEHQAVWNPVTEDWDADYYGQHRAVWNRADPGREDWLRECAYCRDPWHHVDLVTLSLLDDPYDGAEPMILVAGEFVHTDCAEQAARAITPSPYAFPHASEETRSRLRTRLRSGDAVLT